MTQRTDSQSELAGQTPVHGRHPLLRPVWLVSHVIVLVVLVTFPQLSLWQWDRYREEQALQARLEQSLASDPRPLQDLLSPNMSDEELAALEFVPVRATGTWSVKEQVAQRNRSHNGQGGFDLLTPLELDNGRAVLVRRGWVPPEGPASPEPTIDMPIDGDVTVQGFLELSDQQPSFGATDAPDGMLTTVFHADVQRLDRQVASDLLPMVVHLTGQTPNDGDLPLVQPPPINDSTQNLSYTFQWAALTVIVGVGYLVVLIRRVRDHRRGIDSDLDPKLR